MKRLLIGVGILITAAGTFLMMQPAKAILLEALAITAASNANRSYYPSAYSTTNYGGYGYGSGYGYSYPSYSYSSYYYYQPPQSSYYGCYAGYDCYQPTLYSAPYNKSYSNYYYNYNYPTSNYYSTSNCYTLSGQYYCHW